jgi:hypothetical protein
MSDAKKLYERWLLELWHGDFDLIEELVAPDFAVHQTGADGPQEFRGHDGLRQMLHGAHEPFEELTFRIDVGPLAEGDLVAARWTGSGRMRGGTTQMHFGGTDILRLEDGRFAEYWVTSVAY